MSVRTIGVTAACAVLLAACQGGTTGDDCTSSYERVARARTLAALKDTLAHDVLPGARSIRVVGQHDGKRVVNLLNRRHRVVMEVDVWRLADGSWTASRWNQCID